MIEDVPHSKQPEGEGDQKNIVRRIASLDDLEASRQKDPPREQELPEQRRRIFQNIAERPIRFVWHGMPVDVDTLQNLMPPPVLARPRAKDADFVPCLIQRTGFLPDTAVKGNRQVLHDDQNFSAG